MAYKIKKSKNPLERKMNKYKTYEERMAFLEGAEYQNKKWGESLRKT